MKRCVFFDRYGVVNEAPGPGYVERWSDLHVLPDFVHAARVALDRGYGCAVVTNQRGVARGIMSVETLQDIHRRLEDALSARGVPLLGIYACTHNPGECTCRKPQPGLLLRAAREHNVDLAASWMVGDQARDIEAGQRAGCRTIFVTTDEGGAGADYSVPSVAGLVPLFGRVL